MRADILVLGGGPAGAACAIALARAGLEVTVVEASPGPQAKIGETLPPALRPLLERLGLLASLCADGHRVCHGNRSYWGSEQPTEDDFLRGLHGPGWHVDRVRFEGMLAGRAIDMGVRWLWDHRAVDARWADGACTVEVEAPGALVAVVCRFVIDATGRPARFAHGTGSHRHADDNLVGVAAVVQGDQRAPADQSPGDQPAIDSFTQVEAMASGWWYSAPLDGERLVVAFMSDGDLIDPVALRSSAGFLAMLQQAPHTRTRMAAVGRPEHLLADIALRVLPANSSYLQPLAGPGWLAVGDAAVSFDPLSAHGIGSAMTTGYYGACAVADHLRERADAIDAYRQLVVSMYADYRQLLFAHYLAETRFADAPFWRRRRSRSTMPP